MSEGLMPEQMQDALITVIIIEGIGIICAFLFGKWCARGECMALVRQARKLLEEAKTLGIKHPNYWDDK